MAHIPDGVLSGQVLATGAVISLGLFAQGLRRLDAESIPQAAALSAAFFVSSLISIPLMVSSAHLLLNGLMGLMLGWVAVPALAVALILQAVLFGFGGLAVLGVNLLNMALPALVCALLLRPWLHKATSSRDYWLIGAAAGVMGVLLTAVMLSLSLALSGKAFIPAAKIIFMVYLPLAALEGLISALLLGYLHRLAPELLQPSTFRRQP
jgi:cobalt/nickel transport system permease protein